MKHFDIQTMEIKLHGYGATIGKFRDSQPWVIGMIEGLKDFQKPTSLGLYREFLALVESELKKKNVTLKGSF